MKAAVAAGLAVTAGIVLLLPVRSSPDLQFDRSYAVQMSDGINPYQGTTPRPPSALVLQWPLVAVPAGQIRLVVRLLASVSTTILAWAVVRLARLKPKWLPVVAASILASTPGTVAVESGNLAPVVAALVSLAWLGLTPSLMIGVSAALRVYPVVFVPKAWAACVWVAALNLIGWAVIGLGPSEVVGNLSSMARAMLEHPGNQSLAATLHQYAGVPAFAATIAGFAAVMVGAVQAWRITGDGGWAAAAPWAVLAPAIAWQSYQLLLVPAVAWITRQNPRNGVIGALWFIPGGTRWAPILFALLTLRSSRGSEVRQLRLAFDRRSRQDQKTSSKHGDRQT